MIQRAFGVYLGKHELKDGPLRVLPVLDFLRKLSAGRVMR
jgi:hypothetical protein